MRLATLLLLAFMSGCLTATKIHRWESALLGWARKGSPECVESAKVASRCLVNANRTLVGFITILADFFWRSAFWGGNRDREERQNPLVAVIAVVLIVLAPIIATLLQLAISRRREFLADASGALLTRYPEGLASALRKIGSYAAPMRSANNATAHLYISNPFGPGAAKSFLTRIFSTHPPVEDRIKALVGDRAVD